MVVVETACGDCGGGCDDGGGGGAFLPSLTIPSRRGKEKEEEEAEGEWGVERCSPRTAFHPLWKHENKKGDYIFLRVSILLIKILLDMFPCPAVLWKGRKEGKKCSRLPTYMHTLLFLLSHNRKKKGRGKKR